MEAKARQMSVIHDMCWKEMNLLKTNMDKLIMDSERCRKILNEFSSSEGVTNIFSLIVFDRYMTQMLSALNMARKYNIHLEINNLGNTVINASSNNSYDETFAQTRLLKDIMEWRNTFFENGCEKSAERTKMIEDFNVIHNTGKACIGKSNMNRPEPFKNNQANYATAIGRGNDIIAKNVNNLLEILLPKKNIDEFINDFVFEARIVFVSEYKKLEFFVCLNDDHKTLYHISRNTDFKLLPIEDLPLDDVFCIIENDENNMEYILRAIIVPEERLDESGKLIYYVDFGEVAPLTEKFKTCIAPLQYRQIPPLAVKCILEGFEDLSSDCIKDQQKCEQALQKNIYQKTLFRVSYQKDKILHVVMLRTPKDGSNSTTKSLAVKNPFLNPKMFADDDQNSDVLQLPTSPIFNKHTVNNPDSSNLSQLPSTILKNMIKNPVRTAEIGGKIRVMVTHVVNPISFYGIIQNDFDEKEDIFSWNDRQIFPIQEQIFSPKLKDIILSKYVKDGYWYRAKIIDVDMENNMYQVFYVDFGNTEIVPLDRLAKCSEEQLKDPFRAVLFHLANLSIVSDQQNAHSLEKCNAKSVIENLVVMTLDQIINVEVVDRRSDSLVVNFIDEQFAAISKMLIDMGVAERISS